WRRAPWRCPWPGRVFRRETAASPSSIHFRNGHSMRSVAVLGNLYLYGYTVFWPVTPVGPNSFGQSGWGAVGCSPNKFGPTSCASTSSVGPNSFGHLEALDHVPRNRHEMQQAAGHHEQVPDAVPVAKALVVGKEENAHRIEHATRDQPAEADAAKRCEQRLNRYQHD